jgi:hypothetical protein
VAAHLSVGIEWHPSIVELAEKCMRAGHDLGQACQEQAGLRLDCASQGRHAKAVEPIRLLDAREGSHLSQSSSPEQSGIPGHCIGVV